VVIPGLPDDVICFVAGLTPMRLAAFLVVMFLGRLPAYALATYAGGQFATGEALRAVLLLLLFVAVSATAYYHREAIQRGVRRL
nr:TVP38/TMEM64 family protein [Actinomycetota bacterium]